MRPAPRAFYQLVSSAYAYTEARPKPRKPSPQQELRTMNLLDSAVDYVTTSLRGHTYKAIMSDVRRIVGGGGK